MLSDHIRTALITGANVHVVNAYLPDNYSATPTDEPGVVLIHGRDRAGWTLHDYVIPRLASGLYFAREVALDFYIGPDGVARTVKPGASHSDAWHAALNADPTTQD